MSRTQLRDNCTAAVAGIIAAKNQQIATLQTSLDAANALNAQKDATIAQLQADVCACARLKCVTASACSSAWGRLEYCECTRK